MKTSQPSFAMRDIQVMLILGAILIFYGCGNPSSAPSSGRQWNVAKTGSTFTFKAYDIDSSGFPTFSEILVDSIESAGQNLGGMSNVSSFQELAHGIPGRSLYYIAYANNGDFSFGDSAYATHGIYWTTLPTGSRSTTVKDTTFGDGTRETITTSYIGIDTMHLNRGLGWPYSVVDTTFSVIKTQIAIHESSSSSTSDRIEYWWYAPELGFITQIELHSLSTRTNSSGKLVYAQSGRREVLDSYNLK
jgi:hypothetical protein